jgi:hypothetical protein
MEALSRVSAKTEPPDGDMSENWITSATPALAEQAIPFFQLYFT